MLRFLRADKITDTASAARVLSKYRNKEVEFRLDSVSWKGTLLSAAEHDGELRISFTWENNNTDSVLRDVANVIANISSKNGKSITFQVNSDEFHGILSTVTELPPSADVSDYIDAPFQIGFAFNADDQRPLIDQHAILASSGGGALVVPLPANLAIALGCDPDLKYDPHITVAYFPDLCDDNFDFVVNLAKDVAQALGCSSMEYVVRGATTFPTDQGDGTYPFVALIHSDMLRRFHNTFVEKCEQLRPGVVALQFSRKNYTPHVTLKYTQDMGYAAPVKAVAWSSGVLRLTRGKERKMEISLKDHDVSRYSYSKLAYVHAVAEERGLSNVAERLANFLRRREDEEEAYRYWYETKPKNEKEIEDDDEDTEALGPGFEGTDSHIVTYVKSPQTEEGVEEPKFTRKMPLSERV